MKPTYKAWLEQQPNLAPKTITNQISHVGAVERAYGDLDELYDQGRLSAVIDQLRYSSADERRNKPNPSKIRTQGNLKSILGAYRSSAERYRMFRRETDSADVDTGNVNTEGDVESSTETPKQLFRLERDLQAALRRSIEQLEEGLEIIDSGAERSVASGFIDITAKDSQGAIVVIELKAGAARREAVGQILSYMGDMAEEEPEENVRGILVAADFNHNAKAAARMIPGLSLRSYSIRLEFQAIDLASN